MAGRWPGGWGWREQVTERASPAGRPSQLCAAALPTPVLPAPGHGAGELLSSLQRHAWSMGAAPLCPLLGAVSLHLLHLSPLQPSHLPVQPSGLPTPHALSSHHAHLNLLLPVPAPGLPSPFLLLDSYWNLLKAILFLTMHHSYWLSSVPLLSHIRLFATPGTATRQASLSITNSQSFLRLMSIESVVPSNHLILCHPLLLLPSISPSTGVFSNKSVLPIRWPKYWSFSFSISPSNEYSGLISKLSLFPLFPHLFAMK